MRGSFDSVSNAHIEPFVIIDVGCMIHSKRLFNARTPGLFATLSGG